MATKKEAAAKKATPKATPKKVAEPVVSQEELLALGEEMNTLLFPGKEIDFSEMSVEEITAQIKADATNIDPKDQFSDDAKDTLAAIGIDIEWALPAAAKKDIEAGKKAKAAAAKKDVPAKKEKAAKEPTAKKEKKAAPAKKEAAAKEDAYTRSHALLDALKAASGATRESIVAESNKLFMKNGGTDNMNVANYMFGYVVPSLQILGVITKDGKNFLWTK